MAKDTRGGGNRSRLNGLSAYVWEFESTKQVMGR